MRRTTSVLSSRFRRGPVGLLTVLFLTFIAPSLEAQGVVTGQVVDAVSGDPVPAASVLVQGTEIGVLTDAQGMYTIARTPVGARVIEVRALGYRTVVRPAQVAEGASVTLDVELTVRPLEIGGIRVEVLRPDLAPQAELSERQVREANPQDSGQLLRNLDGVDAARRGPLGLDPVVRGLRETEVGTYLDGTRIFPAGPARMDSPLTHLDPTAVSEVEVVKGPYALTWGAGNLSAIRVETAPLPGRGDEVASGSFAAGYDTNLEASEVGGTFSNRSGPVSYWIHGAWREGSDYEPGGDNGVVIPGEYTSSEIRGKIGMDVAENSILSLTGGYQDQGPVDYPGRILTAKFFYASNAALKWVTERGDGALRRLEATAYRNDVSHAMDNRGKPTRNAVEPGMRVPPFGIDVRVDSDLEVSGGRVAADLVRGPWTYRIGADLYSANRNADRQIIRLTAEPTQVTMPPVGAVPFDNVLWPDATIRDIGLFARAGRSLESGLRVDGTIRLDQVSADADGSDPRYADYLDYLEQVYGSSDLSNSETNISGALTLGVGLHENWDLSLGLGSAVRTADASERYSDHLPTTKAQTAAEFMGNPGLNPERSTQGDLWLEGRFERAAFQLNAFARKITDYITIELTDEDKRLPLPIFPETVYRYVNGDATFFGGEMSLSYALSEALTAGIGGSYLWGEETVFPDTAGAEQEEPAFGVSPISGRASLRYEEPAGRYFVEGNATLVGEQDRVALTRGEAPSESYATFDLRAGIAPIPGVNLRFGVQNLFDEEYVNHLNSRNPYNGMPIPEPGRVIYVDLSYGF